MTANDELARMWKEAVMPYFNVLLSQHMPEGFENSNGHLSLSVCLASRPRFETRACHIRRNDMSLNQSYATFRCWFL